MRACVILMALVLTAGSAAAGSVAFLDAERAVVEVEEGRVKMAELEAWTAPLQRELAGLSARLTTLQEQLGRQAAVASAESLSELQGEEQRLRSRFDEARRKFERDLSAKQDQLLADVAVKVGAVASDYAREQGLEAVFVLNAQPLVYVASGANITDTVIRLYNERFPVAAKKP